MDLFEKGKINFNPSLSSALIASPPNQRSFIASWAFSASSSLGVKSYFFSIFFKYFSLVEFDVDISDNMIAQILTDVHLFNFTVLGLNLIEDLFIKLVIMLLKHTFGQLH